MRDRRSFSTYLSGTRPHYLGLGVMLAVRRQEEILPVGLALEITRPRLAIVTKAQPLGLARQAQRTRAQLEVVHIRLLDRCA